MDTNRSLSLQIWAHLSCFLQGSVYFLVYLAVIVISLYYFCSGILLDFSFMQWKREGIGVSLEASLLLVVQQFIENTLYPESSCFVAGRPFRVSCSVQYWKQYSVDYIFLTYFILALLLQRVLPNYYLFYNI